jgi:hypothetical protein
MRDLSAKQEIADGKAAFARRISAANAQTRATSARLNTVKSNNPRPRSMNWVRNIARRKTSLMRTVLCLTMTCAACGTVQEIPGPNLQLAQECDKLPGKLPLPKKNVKGKVVLSEAMDGIQEAQRPD